MTIRERLQAALTLLGECEVPGKGGSKYIAMTRQAGGFYFLGRAGALRVGCTIRDSRAEPCEELRDALLAGDNAEARQLMGLPVIGTVPRSKAVRPASTNLETKPVIGPREGTKRQLVINMLKRPEGATIAQVCEATGWQPHTARALISATISRKMGYSITTERLHPQQGRPFSIYRIAG